MPIQTLQWNDSTGDKIYIQYDEASGSRLVQVSSDPNLTDKGRSKEITFTATGEDGSVSQTLHISQQSPGEIPDGKRLELGHSAGTFTVPANGHNIAIDCYLREYQSGVIVSENKITATSAKLTPISANGTSMQALIGIGGAVWVYGDSRGVVIGQKASYKLTCTYLSYSAEIIVYQEENKLESTEELSPIAELSLPGGLPYNIPAGRTTFNVSTVLRRRYQDVYTSNEKGALVEVLENNAPGVVSDDEWVFISDKTVIVSSRGDEYSEHTRSITLYPEYNGERGGVVSLLQDANLIEDIALSTPGSLYVSHFESSGGGTAVGDPLPASGKRVDLTIELKGDIEYIYSSGARKAYTDTTIPEEFITYRMESDGHFNMNELHLILRCYDRGKSEGPLYTAEIFAKCKGVEIGGNYVYQEANDRHDSWQIKKRGIFSFSWEGGYGSEGHPFSAGGYVFSEQGEILDHLPIEVYAKIETYEELGSTWTSGAYESGEERVISSEPVTSSDEIQCEGDGLYKWGEWGEDNSSEGLYFVAFESRRKVEGPTRTAIVYIERDGERYPGEITLYQEANTRSSESVIARYNYRFEAFNARPEEDPNNNVYTTLDENGTEVLNFRANATYGMLKFRVLHNEEERYFYTSWEYDVVNQTTKVHDAPLDMTHPDFASDVGTYEYYHVKSNTIQNYSLPPGSLYGNAMWLIYLLNTPVEERYLRLIRFDSLENMITPEGEMIIIPGFFITSPPELVSYSTDDLYTNYMRITREANEIQYNIIKEEAVLMVNCLAGTVFIPPSEENHALMAFCPANAVFTSGTPAPEPTANVYPDIQISESWCTYHDSKLIVSKNTSTESRSVVITATYGNQLTQTITVVQREALSVQASVVSITGQQDGATGEIDLSQVKVKILNTSPYTLHITSLLTIQTGGVLTDPLVGYQATSVEVQEECTLTYPFTSPSIIYNVAQASIKLSLTINAGSGSFTQVENLGVVGDYYGPHVPQEPEPE